VDIIRGEMFSEGYGFVVDYLAEILRYLRNYDYSDRYKEYFTLSPDISTRDRDGIDKTFSGLMKILYPRGDASEDELEELLAIAMEGRKRVKDQLLRLDSTYPNVSFAYRNGAGQGKTVATLEEREYPDYYRKTVGEGGSDRASASGEPKTPESDPREKRLTFHENQKGISFDTLLGSYLRGARIITVTDPCVRGVHQMRTFMEFLETVITIKGDDEELAVHLATEEDELEGDLQKENLAKIGESCGAAGIGFTWELRGSGVIHARHIATDHGWKISLDRGLDIFQHYDLNDALSLANRLQRFRSCKAFEATFIRMEAEK
jgi:ATP-dependent Lon protease